MPAPPGNQYGVGHGRPPDLARQLLNADAAAARVARLINRPGSISACAEQLAARWRDGERELPFLDIEGLDNVRDDRLEGEVARRLVEKSRALLLVGGLERGPMEKLLLDIEEGTLLALGDRDAAGSRRKRRRDAEPTKIHADRWAMSVATAAAALDRLVGEGVAQ